MDGVRQRTISNIPVGMHPGRRELNRASLTVSMSDAVPQHMRGMVREITHVRTEPDARREKLATMLLNMVCQEADANCVTLLLTAQPTEPDGITRDQLIAWYEKFGFIQLEDTPAGMLMARKVHERPRIIGPNTLRSAHLVPMAVAAAIRGRKVH